MLEHLMPESEARSHLEPHLSAIYGCVEGGWGDWNALLIESPRVAIVRSATRANLVYDFIADRLGNYFEVQGITMVKKAGIITASLAEGRLALRIKKFQHPEKLTTAGIPTQERLRQMYQQVTLDGLAVTYLTIGYFPDELGEGLDVVAIACSFGNQLQWSINLKLEGESVGVVQPIREEEIDFEPLVRSTKTRRVRESEQVN